MGTSLLHSGVAVNGREYAYGGHDRRGITGVYWTKPRSEPPGGTFRCEILHGFTLATPDEIDTIIHSASEEFLGTSYNLLTQNCNHFTAFLCRKLTGRPGPNWLNRAARIGVALPCIVPREWVDPPEFESAEGELLLQSDDGYEDAYSFNDDADDYNDDDPHGERPGTLRRSSQHMHLVGIDSAPTSGRPSLSGSSRLSEEYQQSQPTEPFDEEGDDLSHSRRGKGKGRAGIVRDSAGHALPPSERITTA